MAREGLKEATFANMEVGEVLGPLRVTCDEHFLRSHAFAIADDVSWPIAPPAPSGPASLLIPSLLRLLNTVYDPDTETALHQREEVWLHSPLRLGEEVEMKGRFVEKFTKRGKGYTVVEAAAHSLADGRSLITHRATEMTEMAGIEVAGGSAAPPSRRVTGETDDSLEPVAAAAPDLPTRAPVVGFEKTFHQDQMAVFSNIAEFWHSIHTDLETARRAGSDRTIAQGLMETMQIAEFGVRFFGRERWAASGWTSMTFLAPIYAGDTLTLGGAVLGPQERADPERLELEVWMDNQDGASTVVGWIGAEL